MTSDDDWLPDDPWIDRSDTEAVERQRRRKEREEKRRAKQGRKAEKAERQAEKSRAQAAKQAEKQARAEQAAKLQEGPAADESPVAPAAPQGPTAEPPVAAQPTGDTGSTSVIPPEVPIEPPGVSIDPPTAEEQTSLPPRRPAARSPLPKEEAELPLSSRPADDKLPYEENFWGDPQPEREKVRRRPGTRGGRLRKPLAIGTFLGALAVLVFLNLLFQPFHGDGSGRVPVTVPKGASVSDVGDLLDKAGVISSSKLFQVRISLAGKRSDLFPGKYVLRKDMSYGAAIDALTTPPTTKAINVTIPEGLSRRQTAMLLKDAGITGNYLAETKKTAGFDPNRFGAQGRAKTLEGFLFPATYELPAKGTAKQLVQRQLDAFEQKIGGVNLRYAKKKNLTVYDILTIASMIEDEASPTDYRNVASVVYNRLKKGIPLGIDATIRFAVNNYTGPLLQSELETDSPYNTRINAGLPPGPISSPGLAAIKAAANPTRSKYLYYVTDAGSCNRLAFSSTDAQFQKDVARYNAARDANGGNSPTKCPSK